ncbi:hypothetical protein INT46_004869, partial [Mucor plumbeus]
MKTPQHFVLISIKEKALYKAIGVYKNEQDAYAAAIVCQMQSIEKSSEKWSKSVLLDNQENIIELCRCIKEDLKTFKERFEYMALQCNQIFENLDFNHHQVLPTEINNNIPSQSISESIFKTKVRNFMDVLRTRSDVEEDLGNSDDDEEEDDEEEEEEEEDIEEEDIEEENEGETEGQNEGEDEDIEEEDIEEDIEEEVGEGIEEEEDIEEEEEEEDEDEEPVTSETAIQEQ